MTKVKIPTRKEQAKLDIFKTDSRMEESKADPSTGQEHSTPQKGSSYFARFLPQKMPTFFGASPKPGGAAGSGGKGKKADLVSKPSGSTNNLVQVLEQHQVHKFQAKDDELKGR